MINLELPKKLKASANQAHQVAAQIFRPVSRKYDLAEHVYPVELDTMAAMVEGGSTTPGRRRRRRTRARLEEAGAATGNSNGGNMAGLLNVIETCWGDVGLTLSIPPYQGARELRDRRGRHRRTARAVRQSVGVDGDHRTELRLRLGGRDRHRRSRRRRVGSQRREDLRHRR